MSRILADLPDDDIAWLDRKAAETGTSRAALVREAVEAYRAERAGNGIERYFGIWKDRADIGDAVDWQRRERAASTRPWDPDYRQVRAEFPDLFNEQDDREHEFYRTRARRGSAGRGSGGKR